VSYAESATTDDGGDARSLETQLEDLQVSTVYTLVEHINTEADIKRETLTKLLFLTNKQGKKFDFTNSMPKLLSALDLDGQRANAPQLVINLLGSMTTVGPCLNWTEIATSGLLTATVSELTDGDARDTDYKIARFLNQCIIPVAIQTNALIIIETDCCSLARVFNEIVQSLAEKYGGCLPFSVVSFSCASALHTAANKEGSFTYLLREKSRRWKERAPAVQDSVIRERGNYASKWDQGTQYIVQ
jgi:hypothetical protein